MKNTSLSTIVAVPAVLLFTILSSHEFEGPPELTAVALYPSNLKSPDSR